MGSLLTPEELQNLARRLLQTERIQQAIQWLLELALDQIQARNQARTAEWWATSPRPGWGIFAPADSGVGAARKLPQAPA
jgi:uncharacterized membrane protein YheB (UPF0754 family)